MNAEERRLDEDRRRAANWKRWGPYLSERQWGTVREDYSPDGECWTYFPHDHARSRTYRWGEDGLLGICDRQGRLCFALALWNEKDPYLKERLFGLTGPQGNHGEDVKEIYGYLDGTPTSSYAKAFYRYPLAEYPYDQLVTENAHRGREQLEYELIDTGVLDDDRFVDVTAEYAKDAPDDIFIRITLQNRSDQPANLHVLPTLWFRNTWSWGRSGEGYEEKPSISAIGDRWVVAEHSTLGRFVLESLPDSEWTAESTLITENETNATRLYGATNTAASTKDAFHDRVCGGRDSESGEKQATLATGTKAAFWSSVQIKPHGTRTLRLRLRSVEDAVDGDGDPTPPSETTLEEHEQILAGRIYDADVFYSERIPKELDDEERRVAREAYAGLIWTKQLYHYVVKDWIEGDPSQPASPKSRQKGRNRDWGHLYNRDVISMPDKWEYPWYAAWDLAFHMIPFAHIDPDFAKGQLTLLLREWYMHPNGQIPAYEFHFSDVNPPVHAWACYRVYKMTGPKGYRDRAFLEGAFQKLLMNFTWWVNRKDEEGNHLFAGGFLGLDNIGVFDRSKPFPKGGKLEQADGTAWMAFYSTTMLVIALELAKENPAYEDMASKFFEHFVHIADAINSLGGSGLWDEEDGFYYDQLQLGSTRMPMRVRSMVGLVPLFAAEVIEPELIDQLPNFGKRMRWFLKNRADLAKNVSYMVENGRHRRLLAIPSKERLTRLVARLLDESEFLSPHGIRSLSRAHKDHPFEFDLDGETQRVSYVSGESDSGMFGGNSNWRGPIWLPMNWLIIEALERYHYFYGDDLKVECPRGSGRFMNLKQAASEIASRLSKLFLKGGGGRRPFQGDDPRMGGEQWRDVLQFHEFFDGDSGRGCGAAHQTGWTALVARALERLARDRADAK